MYYNKNYTIAYPGYRWTILFLVFLATMVNYADRIVLGVTANVVREDLSLDDVQYGYVLTAFSVLYAFGFIFAGKVIDRLGTKLGYLLSMVSWSLAGTLTGTSNSGWSLGIWRGVLGITESGNFPAAIKAVSEWFSPKQRALATALFNSGPHISLVAGPPIIAFLTVSIGWRWTFGVIGLVGLVLAGVWQIAYKHPEHLNNTSEYPGKSPETKKPKVKWSKILKSRRAWGIMIGKFCTDPVWWFYIFWLPPYLYQKYGLNIKEIGLAMPVIYALAIGMANIAGWFAGHLIGKGWSDFRARKTVMLICAMCLPITALSAFTPYPWVVILMVSLAAGAHSGWSANIFTLISDCFPTTAVASVTGVAGFAGGVGGIILSSLAPGYIVKYFGYVPIFLLMALLHPFAILFVHLLVRKDNKDKPINSSK